MKLFHILILLALAALIAFQFIKMKKSKDENNKLMQLVRDSNAQYQEVVEINRSLKNIRHDINKQKLVVKEMEKGGDVKCFTGIDVIDRIIKIKEEDALDKGISFKVEAEILENINVGNGVLISIITNAFDNAMEACCGLDKPWIGCRISKGDDHNFHMVVENSKNSEVMIDTDHMESSKEDKELHGYGLNIIKELVHKHGGDVKIQDKGETFSLGIMI